MSKNFEVLRRARKEAVVLETSGTDLPPNEGGRVPLDQLASARVGAFKPEADDLLFSLPGIDSPPDSARPPQSDPGMLGSEETVTPENQDLLIGRVGGDPLPREGGPYRPDLSDAAQEETVKLVQRVFLSPNSSVPRVVVFSTIDRDSSSSEICLRAGEVLAGQGAGSVCLVDASMHTPLLHQFLGDKLPELVQPTTDPGPIKDFAVRIRGANLWLFAAGSPGLEGPGLIASNRLSARITALKKEFDYVLIAAAPAGSCADAVVLGQWSDGVILVVEANSTRREAARKAKQTLEGAKVKVLGAILNNRTFPIPEALYRNF